ncbi:phosphoesterase [Flavobacterium jejuense]|uniref:Phosphoesterase n=1 Tax=Flavobacterium jejuense TaxID=1544455 RepID=A0ABX0ITR8_9FLAO|nr:metallophosphoesterase [Flavobacterium jejuense]NHN27290.1 phosphoesterase [Flavobacterium jejuense]
MNLFLLNNKLLIVKRLFVLTIVFGVVVSCATKKAQISRETEDAKLLENTSQFEIAHTFYLLGDAGNAKKDSTTIALSSFEEKLNESSREATVLYLGDNIYPKGMPEKNNVGRELAMHQLDVQIDAVKHFQGKTIFIPGNHDWYSNGVKGLKREQEYVEKKLGKNSFLPKNGCPIKTVAINDEIVLIIVDSEWYITNWDNHPTINDDCEIKTRNQFLEEFRNEIKKARGKTTLIAIHHPMFSNGPHGGQYSFREHMNPVPVLGTLKNSIRRTTGIVNADLSNKYYNDLKKNIVAASLQNDRVILISGHEHSLQYLVEDNIPQIISGSGSKATATRNVKGGKFSYGVNGYAILDVYRNGASKIRFISAKNDKVEFETIVLKSNSFKNEVKYPIVVKDSIQSSIYSEEETKKGKFYTFLWGERFRKYYSTPVKAKIAYLDTLKGGLIPVRKGGGTQSKALRLKDKEGKQYVMRAMKKNASQYIQAAMFKDQYVEREFKNTKAESLVKDVFTGSHPYASFTMAILSDAIGLAHLNPKLYYIPKQDVLGDFNQEFGDELYQFEEHASDGHTDLADGDFTGEIISTMDVLKEIHDDESKMVDEKAFIKARLFDMLVGDWDRHQDQWRWLQFKENEKKVYRPLPRDRDQPFSRMSDGLVLGTAVRLIPVAKLLKKYNSDLKNVKGFNIEPLPLDMAFITDATKEVWDEQVELIKKNITKGVVDEAFNSMPREVNDYTVDDIKKMLLNRRDNLQEISDRYFNLVNKYAVITATNKDDYIKIEGKENGEVEVSVFRKKDKTIKDLFHHRIYNPKLTKEIWIYGLDDDDTFEVVGKSRKIKIRLIGGQNNDVYQVEKGRNIVIYDYKTKNNDVTDAGKATLKLQDKYAINVYDYKKLKTNTNQLIPTIGANPDDGFKIGMNNTYTVYGFERNPFTRQHQFKGAYYFATNGYELDYKGEFANAIGNLNLVLQTKFQSPNFSLNFFGYGNETKNNDDDFGLNYNRVKVREFNIGPSLVWKLYGGSQFSFGLQYASIEVQETEGRFVKNNTQLPNYIFDENQFFNTNVKYFFENYDNKAYPTLGMRIGLEIGYKKSLDVKNKSFGYIMPEISFNHKLSSSGKLVLATKVKSQINLVNDFEFYQAASIGGNDGLRGFRNQRFIGNQSFYQNTDIRYSFNRVKTQFVPIKLGIYGAFDYGRVWYKYEDSNKWNNSYGGGVFINGAELLSLNLGVFNSNDGFRVAFGLGFAF